VINQFDENYSCNEVAHLIQNVAAKEFGINVEVMHIENPRVEPEVHYYNPHHSKLYQMGWRPEKPITEGLIEMFEDLFPLRDKLLQYKDLIVPQIKWRPEHVAVKR